MSRCSTAVFAATALIVASTSAAQSPTPSTPQPAPDSQAEIDIVAKRLCKAEPVIGTRLAVKRKCDTPAQLVEYQRQARELIENYRRSPCMAGAESGNNQLLRC